MKSKRRIYTINPNRVPLSLVSNVFSLLKIEDSNDIIKKADKILKELKNYSFPFPILRETILKFFSKFNHLSINTNEKLIELSQFMIIHFGKENLLELVKSELENKFIYHFMNYKVFSNITVNDELISFIICFITRSNKIIKDYLKKYLNSNELNEQLPFLNFKSSNALRYTLMKYILI